MLDGHEHVLCKPDEPLASNRFQVGFQVGIESFGMTLTCLTGSITRRCCLAALDMSARQGKRPNIHTYSML